MTNEMLSRDELRQIINEAAHEAAATVDLSAQLVSINSRLTTLEEQNAAFSKSLLEHMDDEAKQMREAVAQGISDGLARVALDDANAGRDISDLRSLLDAWRDVRAAIWNKVKHIIAVAILAGIAFMVSVFTDFSPFK